MIHKDVHLGKSVTVELCNLVQPLEVTAGPEAAVQLEDCNYGAGTGADGFLYYPVSLHLVKFLLNSMPEGLSRDIA